MNSRRKKSRPNIWKSTAKFFVEYLIFAPTRSFYKSVGRNFRAIVLAINAMKSHCVTMKNGKNVFTIAIFVGSEIGCEKISTISTDEIDKIPAGMFAQTNIFPNKLSVIEIPLLKKKQTFKVAKTMPKRFENRFIVNFFIYFNSGICYFRYTVFFLFCSRKCRK